MKEIEYDPTLFSVVLHYLNNTTKQMTATLEHSARSSIISLVRDFSCSLYTGETDLLYLEEGLPVHTLSCRENLKTLVKKYHQMGEEINDGDYIINNDPYLGNTHKTDFALCTPVFFKNELVFWSMVMAHQLDSGAGQGMMSPNARVIWQDGVTFAGLKLFVNEKENKSVVNSCLSNLRYPEIQKGDLYAMVGAVRIGKKRLLRLCEEYGIDAVKFYMKRIIDYADKRTSEEIKSWPGGTYYGEAWGDSDGTGIWDIKVRCRLNIKGDMVTIDWSESDPQVPGSINSSLAAIKANSCNPIFCALDPTIPHNEGCLKHVEVIAPEGLVVHGKWPASLAQATYHIGDAAVEAVQKALALVVPERTTGGWGREPGAGCAYAGYDRRGQPLLPYMAVHYYGSPGGGATKGNDGWPAIHTACSLGGMKTEAIEIHEINYPGIVEKHEVITDSGGYGQWNGGPSLEFRMRLWQGHKAISSLVEGGEENPCAGIVGGCRGSGGCRFLEHNGTGKRTFFRGMGLVYFDDDCSLVDIAASGGGWGSPLDRDIEKVRNDTRDEFISVRTAREIYGVVLDPDTYELDYEATKKLREKLKAEEKRLIVVPNEPGIAKYVEKVFRPGKDEVLYLEPPPTDHKDWVSGKVQGMEVFAWR